MNYSQPPWMPSKLKDKNFQILFSTMPSQVCTHCAGILQHLLEYPRALCCDRVVAHPQSCYLCANLCTEEPVEDLMTSITLGSVEYSMGAGQSPRSHHLVVAFTSPKWTRKDLTRKAIRTFFIEPESGILITMITTSISGH